MNFTAVYNRIDLIRYVSTLQNVFKFLSHHIRCAHRKRGKKKVPCTPRNPHYVPICHYSTVLFIIILPKINTNTSVAFYAGHAQEMCILLLHFVCRLFLGETTLPFPKRSHIIILWVNGSDFLASHWIHLGKGSTSFPDEELHDVYAEYVASMCPVRWRRVYLLNIVPDNVPTGTYSQRSEM